MDKHILRFRMKIIFSIFMILGILFSSFSQVVVHCADEYIYFGAVPARLYMYNPIHLYITSMGWELNLESIDTTGLISIIALKDGTNVKVYTLPDESLVSDIVLNRMQKHFVTLPNGSLFKIVSNELAFVMLSKAKMPNATTNEGPPPNGFYTAVDGSYVSKEFIFIASQGLTGTPYRFLALEQSDITIKREDNSEQSFKLGPNEFMDLSLSAYKGYSVTSTGYIMIQSGGPGGWGDRSFLIPSVEGGFVGKHFYSDSSENGWDPLEESGFRAEATGNAKVKVWDVEFKRVIQEFEVNEGQGVQFNPKADEIMVESDTPITLAMIHNGSIVRSYEWAYGVGVNYMGVKPNEKTAFFLPINSSVQAFIFSHEDAVVDLDGISMKVKADNYILTPITGQHTIISDKNIVIQIIHWPLIPQDQGIGGFAVVLPCIQTVGITPNVQLTPLATQGFPYTYIIIAVAAVIVVVVGLMMMRRKK